LSVTQPINAQFFIITGGPGSGKTALIEALAAAGHRVVPEAGRLIIKEQVASGGHALPWADRAAFADAMLARDIAAYRDNDAATGPVFFDRGIPDIIGYLTLIGLPIPAAMHESALRYRYNRRVFIAPPWPEIFVEDSERKQTPDEAKRTYVAMSRTYPQYGYEPLELPRSSVAERAAFVRRICGC
jgi:predicted ATPase